MKTRYTKPSTTAVNLSHVEPLLAAGSDVRALQTGGWNESEDDLNLDEHGGGSSIWDR